MSESEIGGNKRQVSESPLVPIGRKLPYFLEIKTSQLIDVLSVLTADRGKDNDFRKRVRAWLFPRTRPGFYLEINNHIHLAYADQRDGHRTQHYWRLFFDDESKNKIEKSTRANSLVVGEPPKTNQANPGVRAPLEWGRMYFRSKVEIKVAQELEKRGVLFFANARGRYVLDGSPVSAQYLMGALKLISWFFTKGNA